MDLKCISNMAKSKNFSKSKKGIGYERYVASILVRQGYRVSFTKKSGDFGADILAQRFGVRLCVQCKAYKAGISAVQEVLGAMAYYGGQGVVAATGFTKSARELAMRSHVILWCLTI